MKQYNYILMNYKYEVAQVNINVDAPPNDQISDIEILDMERAPFSFRYISNPTLRADEASKWLNRRLMPVFRENANSRSLNKQIGENRLKTALRFYAASVTDCYWLKPRTSKKTWEDINFFTNPFSYDVGNFIFDEIIKKPDIISPDITTNGALPKTWRRIDDRLVLFKGGTAPGFQEPCNEEFVSRLLETHSNIPFVSYRAIKYNDKVYSVCENFIKEGYEFIPAIELYRTEQKPSFTSVTQHMINRCKAFNVPGAKEFITSMKALDFIIGNTDRHLGNWGFIYNVDLCQFEGPAPLFDNGTSLFVDYRDDILIEPEQEQIKEEAENILKDVKNNLYSVNIISAAEKALIEQMAAFSYELHNFDGRRINGIVKTLAGRCTVLDLMIERAEIKYEQKLQRENDKELKEAIRGNREDQELEALF